MGDLTAADVPEMRRYLAETADAVDQWFPVQEWVPAWRSEASRERGEVVSTPGGPWGDAPVRMTYAAAAFLLDAVLQCLRAMSGALAVEATPYVTNCLARSALEAGSQAWWLLEPGIGAQRRVARFLLIRAGSARRMQDTATILGFVAADYGETVAGVRQVGADLGLDLVSADGGKRWVCGVDELPSYTARARDFERALKAPGSYSIYSGAAHAQWHAIISGWQLAASADTAGALLVRNPDREAMWSAVFNAANASLEVSRRALELLGYRARVIDLGHRVNNALLFMQRMDLPREWWSDLA